jgi:cell division protein FtsZ
MNGGSDMTLNLGVPHGGPTPELRPRITVIGVGGAGGNAVNNMIRSKLEGVEFLTANTDNQALTQSCAERRIQLGSTVTQGLGAGSRPDIGRIAAEEALEEIVDEIRGSNMVFIAAGMGGGTGTGAAPVIARAAREQGILTVGVVTKPFHFEGSHRMRIAESGIEDLEQFVDTLIIIPNQNLFRVANERTTFADAFKMADDVLDAGVRGVTDLMVMPGLINLDFADIRAVMSEMGKAMMGTGEAEGDRRAVDAAESAISNPLLDDVSMKGARGVLINITGGMDMTLFEVDEAANRIRSEVDPDAFIIFGSTFDEALQGKIRVSVVATGMDALGQEQPNPSAVVTRISDAIASNRQSVDQDRAEAAFGNSGGPQALPVAKVVAAAGLDDVPQSVISVEGGATAEVAAANVASPEPAMAPSNVFIPPPPVVPRQGEAFDRRGEVDYDDDDDHEARHEAGRVSMASLFARVTGAARPRPAKVEPSQKTTATRQAAPDPAWRVGQNDPDDRPPASNPEEDVLDIPAFLRRQAN